MQGACPGVARPRLHRRCDHAPAPWAAAQADGEEAPVDQLRQQLREAVDQTSGPSTVLWVCVTSCLLSAWLVGTAGSWAGKQPQGVGGATRGAGPGL